MAAAGFFSVFLALPGYRLGGLILLALYAIQSEIRFGSHSRGLRASKWDRNSTVLVSVSALTPMIGLVLTIKATSPDSAAFFPEWFSHSVIPGLPAVAWFGVALGLCGLALRLWAVLTLRERYTSTLLIQAQQSIERRGPYLWVRHPGYLGSLLCLNGIALASGNWIALIASLAATSPAYAYRIRVEDTMLVDAFGESYAQYRRQVRALLPALNRARSTGAST